MEYYGRAKTATEQTKITNAKEEIELEIIAERLRANSENDEFNYENIWNELGKKDNNLKTEKIDIPNGYNVFYKGYNFFVDDKEVTHIDNKTDISSNELIPLGPKTVDGINYIQSYEIWNKAQLESFRDRVNAGETFEDCIFWQKANINLNNEDWEPVGYGKPTTDQDKYFSGRYNGENHTITGININNNKMYQALFGDICGNSAEKKVIIENLTVEGNVTGGHIVAGIVGRAGNAKIVNCKNKVNVNSTLMDTVYEQDASSSGGIVGRTAMGMDVEIMNCENYGIINGASAGVIGGIVGLFQQGTISECTNYSNLETLKGKTGGIVGFMVKGDITNCHNTKKIKGWYYVGGICGLAGYVNNTTLETVNIKECNNTGEITGESYVGGIVGWTRKNGTVELCSNAGKILATGHEDYWASAGGIVGYFGGNTKISDCYNIGNIESNYRGIGGISGSLTGTTDGNSYIKNCYNIGNITNNSLDYNGRTGGIWGLLETTTTMDEVTNCWQLQNCIKQGTDTDQTGVENKTEDEIKELNWENYTVVAGKNGGYPILNWENN